MSAWRLTARAACGAWSTTRPPWSASNCWRRRRVSTSTGPLDRAQAWSRSTPAFAARYLSMRPIDTLHLTSGRRSPGSTPDASRRWCSGSCRREPTTDGARRGVTSRRERGLHGSTQYLCQGAIGGCQRIEIRLADGVIVARRRRVTPVAGLIGLDLAKHASDGAARVAEQRIGHIGYERET